MLRLRQPGKRLQALNPVRIKPSFLMSEHETCKRKLGDVPKQRIISFCPLYGVKGWGGSRCVACARQVYVMPDPGLKGAAIGGDAIAEVCIRKPSRDVKPTAIRKQLSCI
jgi:hypothetical protein